MLDRFDDTLAAIHRISKGVYSSQPHPGVSTLTAHTGQVKVIIAPHDSQALRGANDVPCDAYCKELKGAYLDFYSVEKCKFSEVISIVQR
jgi:hypothetical protein